MANNIPVGVAYADPDLATGWSINGTAVTTAAATLNVLTDNVTSVATATTPASGTCAVQLTFKNRAAAAISSVRRMQMYISDVNGVPSTAVTSFATLTNGTVDTAATGVTGKYTWVNTTSAGLLGITVTASAGTYYLSFVLAEGRVITTSAIVVN